MDKLKSTPLFALHQALGAKMVGFAGYAMPLQYPDGIMTEHRWTRDAAGLFDVSHMGQARLVGPDQASVASAMEALTCMDAQTLEPGAARYTVLLNDAGGIMDDLIVTRPAIADGGALSFVVNAACKDADFAHIAAHLPAGVHLETMPDQALLAIQGPRARDVMRDLAPACADLVFMTSAPALVAGVDTLVSCSGYTGEDGFEISVPSSDAQRVAEALLADERVRPIGLGARDSLRLEAGLCLYGHDMDADTTPVEASLKWAIAKPRRTRADFPGADRILAQLSDGPARTRVGFEMADRAPAREGAKVFISGAEAGVVTSGGFGPSVNRAIGMAYVPPSAAQPGQEIEIEVRGTRRAATVTRTPFAPQRYYRGA